MQFSLETSTGLERRLIITVPAASVDQQVQKRLQQISKRVRLDGFRPGKVPFKVMKRRYGPSARQEVLGEVIQNSYVAALEESQVKPAGAPSVEPKVNEEGKDLEFVATFEVYPEITLGDFSSISVETPEAEVADENVATMIETLREQQKVWENSAEDATAENSDTVVIDYVGTVDGEAFEGGSAKGQELVLGSDRMIPGFESGLIGAKAGEERTLNLVFPENYYDNLKGKEVEFKVTIKSVKKPVLPELNDAFFLKFGVKEGGKAKFLEEVVNNMKRELKQAIRRKVKDQVLDGLLKIHSVQLPAALVNQEVNQLREQFAQRMQGMGENNDFDVSKLPAELFNAEAEKRVSLGLIVGEIISANDMKADDGRVREMIEEIAAPYQQPRSVIDWYYGNEKQLEQVKYVVLEEQVVDTILEAANVTTKACSYDEAIRPAQENNNDSADEETSEKVSEESES